MGEDFVLLTSADITWVSRDGKTRWEAPFKRREWIAGGGLVKLADGDLLAYLFGQISDSGVQVVRLKGSDGKVVWQARCAPLDMTHSKYRHHATLVVEGDRVRVTSRGAYGTFVELLDVRTGSQLKRTLSDPDPID
jgi:hypothetical protein